MACGAENTIGASTAGHRKSSPLVLACGHVTRLPLHGRCGPARSFLYRIAGPAHRACTAWAAQGALGTLGGMGALGGTLAVGNMRDMDSGRGADDAGDAGDACVDSLHTRWTRSNHVLHMFPPCLASALAPVCPCVCCLLHCQEFALPRVPCLPLCELPCRPSRAPPHIVPPCCVVLPFFSVGHDHPPTGFVLSTRTDSTSVLSTRTDSTIQPLGPSVRGLSRSAPELWCL